METKELVCTEAPQLWRQRMKRHLRDDNHSAYCFRHKHLDALAGVGVIANRDGRARCSRTSVIMVTPGLVF